MPALPPIPPATAAALIALRPRLLRRARRLGAAPETAEDMAQEALARVWSRLADGVEIGALENYAMTALRRAARRAAPPDAALSPGDAPAAPPTLPARLACADALAAIDRLPPQQAALMRLVVETGAGEAELVRLTGLKRGTVASRLARARVRLRAELDLAPGASVAALYL
ncbi:DNA-directed RNA polymerase specialized sigma24 family protein [Rhodovulum iodosum]|uniref:DNA-directed RNA polymerase specialized sigma24 family protein n=1 Tax=Rhodovulum iodosum TaxID=68291 RepID=A0ABV3XN37_9RHOB|nr:sigma factor [Rhodovulum robiginosum]